MTHDVAERVLRTIADGRQVDSATVRALVVAAIAARVDPATVARCMVRAGEGHASALVELAVEVTATADAARAAGGV